MPADKARHEARRRFGSYALQVDHTRDRDLFVWLETWLADLRYGLRNLRRNPVFAITAVLTIAIGIGACTAVFTLLYGLLLRSLPVAAPQDLVRLNVTSQTDARLSSGLPYRLIQEIRPQQRSFTDLSAWL